MPGPQSPVMYQPPLQGETAPRSTPQLGVPVTGDYDATVDVDHFGLVRVRAYAEGSGVSFDVYGRRFTASDCLGTIHVSGRGSTTPAFRPGVDPLMVAEALRLASQKQTCPPGFKAALQTAAAGLEIRVGAGPSAGFAFRR